MRHDRLHGHPRALHAARRAIPPSVLCAKLGEDFELFSDRMDDALECENLIHHLESLHDAEVAAGDFR